MEIYKILMLITSTLFIAHALVKIGKGMSFREYSIGRSFGLWLLFCWKVVFIIATTVMCINWSFLTHKINF